MVMSTGHQYHSHLLLCSLRGGQADWDQGNPKPHPREGVTPPGIRAQWREAAGQRRAEDGGGPCALPAHSTHAGAGTSKWPSCMPLRIQVALRFRQTVGSCIPASKIYPQKPADIFIFLNEEYRTATWTDGSWNSDCCLTYKGLL